MKPFQATFLFLVERDTLCIVKDAYAQPNNLMNDVYGPHYYVEYVQVGMLAG